MATAKDNAVTENNDNKTKLTSQEVKPKKVSSVTVSETPDIMGTIFNRNKYPVFIDYGDPKNPTENLMLSPKQQLQKVVESKLPKTLPKGVAFIPKSNKNEGVKS